MPSSESFNSHRFKDWLRGNIITNSTPPNYGTSNSKCEQKRFYSNFIPNRSSKKDGLLENTYYYENNLQQRQISHILILPLNFHRIPFT